MPFQSDFATLMPDTIIIEPAVSRDKFNAITYGTAVSYRCRHTERVELVTTFSGSQGDGAAKFWCEPHATSGVPVLTPDCRLTLPDGSHPALLRFEVPHDHAGAHHFVLYCDRPYRE